MKESDLQKAVMEYLQILENQGRIYSFRSGSGVIQTKTGNWFKSGKAGCPDISVITNDGYIGLEIKTAKGKLSDGQIEAKRQIESLGQRYHVVRSIDDVVDIFGRFNNDKESEG